MWPLLIDDRNDIMRYLYVFGYCTPTQWANNQNNGWDDEDSYACFIDAESEADALSWGQELSERFVGRLFKKANWESPIPSWREARYANWLERDPLSRFSGLALESLPIVQCFKEPQQRHGSFPSVVTDSCQTHLALQAIQFSLYIKPTSSTTVQICLTTSATNTVPISDVASMFLMVARDTSISGLLW
jgi:hypothetical protein